MVLLVDQAGVAHGRVEHLLRLQHHLARLPVEVLDDRTDGLVVLGTEAGAESSGLHLVHRDAAHLDEAIAGAQARAIRRRTGEGEQHATDRRVLEHHADPAELAGGLAADLLDLLRSVEARVLVETRHHPPERVVDELLGVHVACELLQREVAHGADQLDVAVGQRARETLRDQSAQEAEHESEHKEQGAAVRAAPRVSMLRPHREQDTAWVPNRVKPSPATLARASCCLAEIRSARLPCAT